MGSQMRRGLAVVFLLLIVLAGAPPATADSDCSAVQRWVQQHRSELPRTYEKFLASPAGLRRAIFEAVEPEVKSLLWVEHLQNYLDRNPRLNPEQFAAVRQAIALAEQPDTFATPRQSPLWATLVGEPLADLERSVGAAFGPRQTTLILSGLGGREVAETTVITSSITAVFCQCSSESDWCTGGAVCIKDGGACSHQQGCGTFWRYICNGLCGENTNTN